MIAALAMCRQFHPMLCDMDGITRCHSREQGRINYSLCDHSLQVEKRKIPQERQASLNCMHLRCFIQYDL